MTYIELKVLNLTSFLHKDEEFVEKLLPLWVIIQFIKLEDNTHPHAHKGNRAINC